MDFETLYDLHTNPKKLYGYEMKDAIFANNESDAYRYALLTKPWYKMDSRYSDLAEKTIASDERYAYMYARDVLNKTPWHEVDAIPQSIRELAEKNIASDEYDARRYKSHFKSYHFDSRIS